MRQIKVQFQTQNITPMNYIYLYIFLSVLKKNHFFFYAIDKINS
ncbi:hypothetical protein pb186bvf_018105 [Paramecium bursaria]